MSSWLFERGVPVIQQELGARKHHGSSKGGNLSFLFLSRLQVRAPRSVSLFEEPPRMTLCGHLAGHAPVHYLLSLWENRGHESQDFLYSFSLLWCLAWISFSPDLSVSVKGNITIIEPCLTEDTEAQRGEATCPRPHRTTGQRDLKSLWDGLPQSPCLSTPPPPQRSQDFTPPTGPGG